MRLTRPVNTVIVLSPLFVEVQVDNSTSYSVLQAIFTRYVNLSKFIIQCK